MKSYRSRLYLTLLLVTVLAVLLTACGGGEEPAEPIPTAEQPAVESPTNTPEPPPTDTPVPTATAVPEVSFDLTRFESAEGGYAIGYPSDWFTDGLAGFTTFASAEELMDSPDPGEEGGIALVIAGETAEFDSTDPVAILNEVVADLGLVDEMEVVDEPTAVTINGNAGATTTIKGTTDNDIPLSALISLAIDGDSTIIMVAATPTESEAEFFPIFKAMVDTIEIFEPVAPPLPESQGILLFGVTETGSVTAAGPSAWEFIGLEGEMIDIVLRPLAEDFDLIFDLLDENGSSVLDMEVDESFGLEELRGFTLPASGTYTISIYGFSGSVGDYEITLAEAGSLGGETGSISYGDVMSGSIISVESSNWTFAGEAGDFVDITVAPFDFDLVVDVLDPNGFSILDEGPLDESIDTEFIRILLLPETGTYTIVVTGYESETGDFEVALDLSNGGQPGSIVFAADTLEESESAEGHAFPFTALAGEVVTFHVDPEFGFDTVVEIINDDTDEVLDEIDATTGFEEAIFTVPEDGNYYFMVKGFEGAFGEYDATLLGSDFVIFELAVGDGVIGRFGADGLIDYIYRGTAGDTIVFTAENEDDLDILMTLTDLDDNVLLEVDGFEAGGTETLSYTFTEDLVVFLTVAEFNANQGQFILFVETE